MDPERPLGIAKYRYKEQELLVVDEYVHGNTHLADYLTCRLHRQVITKNTISTPSARVYTIEDKRVLYSVVYCSLVRYLAQTMHCSNNRVLMHGIQRTNLISGSPGQQLSHF